MSFFSEVYNKLVGHQFDQKDINQKQGQSYVKWSKAWAELCKVYPDSEWSLGDVTYYPDRTATVSVSVTVRGNTRDSATRTMTLPVLNGNKPVVEPNSFQVNTAQMRCMVKCLALFGLGLYIYEGEEEPDIDDGTAEDIIGTLVTIAPQDVQNKFWKAAGANPDNPPDTLSGLPAHKLRPALKWLKEQVA